MFAAKASGPTKALAIKTRNIRKAMSDSDDDLPLGQRQAPGAVKHESQNGAQANGAGPSKPGRAAAAAANSKLKRSASVASSDGDDEADDSPSVSESGADSESSDRPLSQRKKGGKIPTPKKAANGVAQKRKSGKGSDDDRPAKRPKAQNGTRSRASSEPGPSSKSGGQVCILLDRDYSIVDRANYVCFMCMPVNFDEVESRRSNSEWQLMLRYLFFPNRICGQAYGTVASCFHRIMCLMG